MTARKKASKRTHVQLGQTVYELNPKGWRRTTTRPCNDKKDLHNNGVRRRILAELSK